MLEIPESNTLAEQLMQTVKGKIIQNVTANASPHKLTWYFGEPSAYHTLLTGRRIDGAHAVAGNLELLAGNARILLQDGVNLRYYAPGEPLPKKHQLYIEFEDFSSLVAVVQMYGGISAFLDGENQNPYYLTAKEKPSPLTGRFDEPYFESLCACEGFEKLSAKAFLATKQRIPGLGNGVLQDILYNAKIHPKCKMGTLTNQQRSTLYHCIKNVLVEMTVHGGRDTERDLFGCLGGYKSKLSKNTVGKPCPVCGSAVVKEPYLGGSIYYCEGCQAVK